MRSPVGARPVSSQRSRGALGLDPVRGVEVVALLEYLEREVRKDLSRPLTHPRVVVGVAPPAEGKVDGPFEGAAMSAGITPPGRRIA
jgi:hypothetical protein